MRLLLTTTLAALAFCSFGQTEIKLYPVNVETTNNEQVRLEKDGRVRSVFNVSNPSITVFLPDADKATGTAVILCAGGGLMAHSWGTDVLDMAEWLNQRGIAAIGLKYRTRTFGGKRPQLDEKDRLSVSITEFDKLKKSNTNPDQSGNPDPSIDNAINDALRALEIVGEHAAEWHIDMSKVGFLGFSAGGGVAIGAVLRATNQPKAAFLATIYGPSLIDVDVPKNAPKLFIATRGDHHNVAAGLVSLYLDWKKAGANAEMHIYDDGAGPFGPDDVGNTSGTWREGFYRWLTFNGF